MSDLFSRVEASADFIRKIFLTKANHAVILGTGLGDFASDLSDKIVIPYSHIPFFPTSTVDSHTGELAFGRKHGVPVIIMSGRFHYYEGYSAATLTFAVRVLHALGVTHLILTNASGAVNPHFSEGDLILVNDHINLIPDHPLRGEYDARFGERFPDMLYAYDPESIILFKKLGSELNIHLSEGVYLALQGPSLETRAEYKMARILGADLVGMSTVPEVIVARQCGLKVTVFSMVTNVCFPVSASKATSLEDIIGVASRSGVKLQVLLDKYFENLKRS